MATTSTTVVARVVNEVRNPSNVASKQTNKAKVVFDKDACKKPSLAPITDEEKTGSAVAAPYNPMAYGGEQQPRVSTVEVVNMTNAGEFACSYV